VPDPHRDQGSRAVSESLSVFSPVHFPRGSNLKASFDTCYISSAANLVWAFRFCCGDTMDWSGNVASSHGLDR